MHLSQAPRHPHEMFTWGAQRWDVARLWTDVDTGFLAPECISLGNGFIRNYCASVLGLTSPTQKEAFGLMMRVDIPRASSLPIDALSVPLVLLWAGAGKGLLNLGRAGEADAGASHVLADGNHRIARAFLEGVESLSALVLNEAQSAQYRVGR